MHVGVDEAGRHRPVGKIDDGRVRWPADRLSDGGDCLIFYKDFDRTTESISQPVEHLAANKNR